MNLLISILVFPTVALLSSVHNSNILLVNLLATGERNISIVLLNSVHNSNNNIVIVNFLQKRFTRRHI